MKHYNCVFDMSASWLYKIILESSGERLTHLIIMTIFDLTYTSEFAVDDVVSVSGTCIYYGC